MPKSYLMRYILIAATCWNNKFLRNYLETICLSRRDADHPASQTQSRTCSCPASCSSENYQRIISKNYQGHKNYRIIRDRPRFPWPSHRNRGLSLRYPLKSNRQISKLAAVQSGKTWSVPYYSYYSSNARPHQLRSIYRLS